MMATGKDIRYKWPDGSVLAWHWCATNGNAVGQIADALKRGVPLF